jgi:nucleoside phosphorylase/CheY-like chemotaxis protein
MVKILLVEDEPEKKRIVISATTEKGELSLSDIDEAADVVSAKRCLMKKRYDLLILDINIPPRADRRTEVGAGLEVLRFIRNDVRAHVPAHVVGLTAYDNGFTSAAADFLSPLWKLIKFEYNDHSWREALQAAISHLVALDIPPYPNDGKTYHTDLGIIVGLEDVELDSVRSLPGDWCRAPVRNDFARYYRGTFHAGEDGLDVVAVAAPRMGMPAATVTASKLIHTFRPRVIVAGGICAGVRGKVDIGDILVADPCWDWGSGKWIVDHRDGCRKFLPAPYQWRIDETLRSWLKEVGEDSIILQNIHKSFMGSKPRFFPKVVIDAMASGGSVLQSNEVMDEVREQHKNLIGIEMESFGVFTAAEYAAEPRPRCLSVKVVCDFGDSDKSDSFQTYAAFVSARFLYEFALRRFIPSIHTSA